ncbi:MAG: hypothetical protein RL011_1377, partial [Pseudomonadota bacterium]
MPGVKSLAHKGSRDFHSARVNPQSFFAIAPFLLAKVSPKCRRDDAHQVRFSCASGLAIVNFTGVLTTIWSEFALNEG